MTVLQHWSVLDDQDQLNVYAMLSYHYSHTFLLCRSHVLYCNQSNTQGITITLQHWAKHEARCNPYKFFLKKIVHAQINVVSHFTEIVNESPPLFLPGKKHFFFFFYFLKIKCKGICNFVSILMSNSMLSSRQKSVLKWKILRQWRWVGERAEKYLNTFWSD